MEREGGERERDEERGDRDRERLRFFVPKRLSSVS